MPADLPGSGRGDVDTDVLVVGGGPVGLAAAIEARLAGLSALVLEPRPGPVDKACGEGLMPGALGSLHRLGVDPAGHPLAGLPLVLQGIEREAPSYMPLYGEKGLGRAIDALAAS